MEICMTVEEFTRSVISNYNRLRQETKEYMICEINDALRSAYLVARRYLEVLLKMLKNGNLL